MGGEWMIGKFATASALTLLVLTVLLGARGFAQTTPAGQTPAATPAAQQPATPAPTAQQPASGQEPADEESTSRRRKVHPHDFKNWNFNAGVGGNTVSGTTYNFVRNGGEVVAAGVERNANKFFGLRADFIYANLPLRDSAERLAQAGGATNYALAFTLDPVINVPFSNLYTGYVLIGPGFYHRSGKLNSDTAIPGSACNPFWNWWGACNSVSIPLSGDFVKSNENEIGINVGAGLARKVHGNVQIYGEYRIIHGSHDNIQTDFRPITIGVRW
jgi:opacity protein-like surface antigen